MLPYCLRYGKRKRGRVSRVQLLLTSSPVTLVLTTETLDFVGLFAGFDCREPPCAPHWLRCVRLTSGRLKIFL